MPRYEEDLKTNLGKTRMAITVGQYIRRLRVLNDGEPLASMKFLMDFNAISKKIDDMGKATSTKTSYLTAICAVLSMYPKYSKLYKQYVDKTTGLNKGLQDQLESNLRNEKQEESIVPMKEVVKVRDALKAEIAKGPPLWDTYLSYLCLCLYTLIQPRRNKDYSEMFFVFDEPKTLDASKNYYILSTDTFIFNNYKTSHFKGEQRVKVSPELADVLERYIEYYMLVIPMDKKETAHPLLVLANGKRINPTNGITRILNKALGKNIGSSALRHIFLSNKYGDVLKEMKADAEVMAHGLDTQKDYVKTDVVQ